MWATVVGEPDVGKPQVRFDEETGFGRAPLTLPTYRCKTPSFSYGDIRRSLSGEFLSGSRLKSWYIMNLWREGGSPQEESYTSKASFLDGDEMSAWNDAHQHVEFTGKRIKRGLYPSGDRHTANADAAPRTFCGKATIDSMSSEWLEGFRHPLRVRLP